MRQRYTVELTFVALVTALSIAGFSSLVRGDSGAITAYHVLHAFTSLAWLGLLAWQLLALRTHRADRHRAVGASILAVAPILVASVTLLTAHSAARNAAHGTVDDLVVQNVTFTVELALLLFLAVRLRQNRAVHGALLLSSALMFLVIALFFTLITYVPGYRIEGPETFDRFAKSGQLSAMVGSAIGLAFFLRNVRTGWPWLLTAGFFMLNGYLQLTIDRAGRTLWLTLAVGSVGELPAFTVGLAGSTALIWAAWKQVLLSRQSRGAV